MADDQAAEPRFVRGRIVMLVDNGVRGDSRVQKEAAAAAEAGWEVILLGRTTESKEERWRIGLAEVRLIPMNEVLGRKRHEFRRPFLRRPLAYPPNGIADYHARRVAAWRADIAARFAELDILQRSDPSQRFTRRRLRLRIELLAAKVRGRWVAIRRGQLQKANNARKRMDGPWARLVMKFWLATMGDRAWRRLEPRLWEFELAFGKVIDQLRPDVIHANDFYMLPVGARAVLRARAAGRQVALVWDAHELVSGLKSRSENIRWLPAHILHEREYAKYADAVITVSEELAEALQRAHGLPERPTVVLNAPEVHDTQSTGAPSLREVCGVGPDTPLLVYSGAAAAQRGLDTMVEALPYLPDVHVAFVVATPPSRYVQSLLTKAESLGVAGRVHLAPYVPFDQVVEYLSGADVGVIPIHRYPNHEIALITKFFEYAHARLPMVVSDVRAMANATRELGQGEVFRAQDVDDYVRAVKLVLGDLPRYRAAYDRPGLLESWTWRAQSAVLNEVYHRVAPPRARRAAGDIPDVSVIVPVYNGMPHLVRNIRSLLNQTLGLDRLEFIAVDDGSTDDSRARLDAFTRRYPGIFRVSHRPTNSGGPATPYNIGLEMARGRYVTFLGAGDVLGPEALERMVTAADEFGSDVVAMKLVGVNGRPVPTELFSANHAEIDPLSPTVVGWLSNTKLFRRDLIEKHKIRYPEEIKVGSDQVFTLAALSQASRVTVLSDYDYYFAIARRGMGAASRTTAEERLHSAGQVIRLLGEQVPPGPVRDAALRRSFAIDLPGLLNELPALPRDTQELISAGVGQLVDLHLTDALADQLDAGQRVRLRLAQRGNLDALLDVIREDAGPRPVPIVEANGQRYLGYGCREAAAPELPDDTFRITHDLARQVAARVEVVSLRWGRDDARRPALLVSARCPSQLADADQPTVAVTVGGKAVPVTRLGSGDPGGPGLRISIPIDTVLQDANPGGQSQPAEIALSLDGTSASAAVRVAPTVSAAQRFARPYGRLSLMRGRRGPAGELVVDLVPVTTRRVVGKIIRTLRGGRSGH